MQPTCIDSLIPNLDVAALPEVQRPPTAAERKADRRHNRVVARKRFATLSQHAIAADLLNPLPGPGESIHGVMSGHFSAWSLIVATLDLLAVPVDATICTLGFNRANCDSLCGLLDAGKVRSATLVVSDYFRSSDRTIFADCRQELERRGQRVTVCRSHAKLALLDTGERQIVIETSANLRSSMNWEQFSIHDDAALLAFHVGWIQELTRQ